MRGTERREREGPSAKECWDVIKPLQMELQNKSTPPDMHNRLSTFTSKAEEPASLLGEEKRSGGGQRRRTEWRWKWKRGRESGEPPSQR